MRPYQQRVIAEVSALWRNGVDRAIACLPTGAGKTVVGGELAKPFRNPLSICHTTLLADQLNARLCPAATWQGLRKRGVWPHGEPDLIVVDEVHVGDSPDWQQVFDMIPDHTKVLGLTATPWRFSHGTRRGAKRGSDAHIGGIKNARFGKGLGDLFGAMVVGVTPLELVRDGYLVPLRVFDLVEAQDAEARRQGKRGPSWSTTLGRECGRITSNSDRRLDIFDAWMKHGEDRKTMVFTHLVSAAERVCAAFLSAGVSCTVVHGKLGKKECAKRLEAFKAGKVKVIINVMQLTAGIDVPDVGCIIIDRGCNNLNTYIQVCGRGARTAPGKTDCLILDLTGCSAEHGHPQKDQDYWVCTSEGRPVSELACEVCGTRLSPMFPARCMRCDPFCPKLGDPQALLDTGMRVYATLKDLAASPDEELVEALKNFRVATETEGHVLVAEIARAQQRIDAKAAQEARETAAREWRAALERQHEARRLDCAAKAGAAHAAAMARHAAKLTEKAAVVAAGMATAGTAWPDPAEYRHAARALWVRIEEYMGRGWSIGTAVRDVRQSLPRYAGKYERETYTVPPDMVPILSTVRAKYLEKTGKCMAMYELTRLLKDPKTAAFGDAWCRKRVIALFGVPAHGSASLSEP